MGFTDLFKQETAAKGENAGGQPKADEYEAQLGVGSMTAEDIERLRRTQAMKTTPGT